MNATKPSSLHTDLVATQVLAGLLARLEQSPTQVDAQQYRSVVLRLMDTLTQSESGPELSTVLDKFPAVAELYENLNYQHAGLCRSALDSASSAEQQARQWIARAKQGA